MAETKVSPLAPAGFPAMAAVAGLRLSTAAAGIRYAGRDDLMLAEMPPGSTVAGVFTRSLCTAAPVDWCRDALAASSGRGRAIIVNAGNANAFTGAAGLRVAEHTAQSVAAALGADADEVLVASTGVIGEQLPAERIDAALPGLVAGLSDPDPSAWEAAAQAIGTTDTFPKGASAPVAGTEAHVAGIAKGSGMIAPDMATMLAFLFTDLAVDAPTAHRCLAAAVEASFNRVTVDSDTSTSDTVLLAATGASGQPAALRLADSRDALAATGASGALSEEHHEAFQDALDAVTLDLAHQIVRDGEGATKFVAVTVSGAADDAAAAAIARAVADSPLVKTALAASDANWGRIVAAVGKAGQRADRDRLSIWIGDEQCAGNGVPHPGYSEERATEHLLGHNIELRVDVGVGDGEATIWTCDLTHGYIDINAGYRT